VGYTNWCASSSCEKRSALFTFLLAVGDYKGKDTSLFFIFTNFHTEFSFNEAVIFIQMFLTSPMFEWSYFNLLSIDWSCCNLPNCFWLKLNFKEVALWFNISVSKKCRNAGQFCLSNRQFATFGDEITSPAFPCRTLVV